MTDPRAAAGSVAESGPGSDGQAELHRLAGAYGIDTRYWDWRGEQRTVADATLRSVLAAFDVDAGTVEACRAALAEHERTADGQAVPPCIVLRQGHERQVPAPGRLVLELEDGGVRTLVPAGGTLTLPADLPLGYHRLTADDDRAGRTHLIVVPDELPLPAALAERPGWGLAAQLYSVRSRGSWGVGDLADLRELAVWAASAHGADFVLINPVHAGEAVVPLNPSPYLPTSRRFANPLYLRIEDVPEYADLPAAQRAEVDRLGRQVREQAPPDRIERDPAWTAKLAAVQLVLAAPLTPPRAAAWSEYRDGQGSPLQRFATWCVLCELYGADWRDWPAPLRDPSGPAVARTAAEHAERVEFFARLQWLLDEQLAAAQNAATGAGMALGIVHDVAVGVSPAGADAWAWQDTMATTVTVGAPPDAYAQLGQDWRQPPWRPDRLARSGYAPFREMFGNVLRHCGGVRVDHVIGLFRLWWIPSGAQAHEGTYVHYDHEALIGVLALEAQRAGAVVIGEDLGNVEPTVRTSLRERGLLGTSILWFEFADDVPVPPQRWREYCLASVTTHDLPPTAGYLAGEHIRLRDRLGLLTRSLDDELAAGRAEQAAWIDELQRCGLLAPGERDEERIVLALHRFLTLTPSRLRAVALTDAVGDRRTQNQPGTTDEYPNWRVPLAGPDGTPLLLEGVVADPRAARLLGVFGGGTRVSRGG